MGEPPSAEHATNQSLAGAGAGGGGGGGGGGASDKRCSSVRSVD
jgi:hypothetical protein